MSQQPLLNADGQWNTRPGGGTVIQPNSHIVALGTLVHLQKIIELARR